MCLVNKLQINLHFPSTIGINIDFSGWSMYSKWIEVTANISSCRICIKECRIQSALTFNPRSTHIPIFQLHWIFVVYTHQQYRSDESASNGNLAIFYMSKNNTISSYQLMYAKQNYACYYLHYFIIMMEPTGNFTQILHNHTYISYMCVYSYSGTSGALTRLVYTVSQRVSMRGWLLLRK